MKNAEQKGRSRVVFGAMLIQISLGAIYAWSVFTKPLVAAGWSPSETQIIFSVGLACFAIAMVLAGSLLPKVGPQSLAIGGGVLLGFGYLAAGFFGPQDFWTLLLFIGVMGGFGIGLTYVVPIAVGMRWFPDKKGMITGLAVAGFGFGAMLWVKLAGSWGGLLLSIGLGNTFMLYGALFFITILWGGVYMVFPPEGWRPANYQERSAQGGGAALSEVTFSSAEMIRTPQFYMIFFTFLFSASAGLMCIGLMKLFPSQALMANGMGEMEALAVAGTAMAVYFSLANGLGRIGWGMISDKIGRKTALMIMTAMQGIMMLLFPLLAGTTGLLFLGAALIGFNFGGNFALFPTLTADTFGSKFVGQNYGFVFLSYGLGGIFGPILGGRLGDLGNFPLAFSTVGILCLVASVIISQVGAPVRKAQGESVLQPSSVHASMHRMFHAMPGFPKFPVHHHHAMIRHSMPVFPGITVKRRLR